MGCHCCDQKKQTMEDIRHMLGISHGTTHVILTEDSKFLKMCAQWVPHSLTKELKLNRTKSLWHLEWYHDKECGFLSYIVAKVEI
ncbi:hypothetical protein TNCT_63771 [Trichonephila clavata]|uniref:Uncharacterized protein n=1 Tax=Trichonephila clavata TaxID=2740835 RepID=A0A8X6H2M3_TRICU|nr:hypothetical protein TNCT_63771 [Trichonephila clavata]